MDLRGRTALVTGANRGIGRALAERLAREPLELLLAGARNPDEFEIDASNVRNVALDLSSRDAIDASLREIPELDRVDLLVNNAGQITGGLLEEQEIGAVYSMFQVNLVAVTHLTHAVLPGMLARGRGKIVNNASISGYAFFPGATTYAAAKAGVVAFSESLRRELKETGVGVLHLVTPGVETRMMDQTRDAYRGHIDTTGWDLQQPDEWASKVVAAILDDRHVLGPGGRTALAKLAARGPAVVLDTVSERIFSREPRSKSS